MYAFKVCELKTSGLLEVSIPCRATIGPPAKSLGGVDPPMVLARCQNKNPSLNVELFIFYPPPPPPPPPTLPPPPHTHTFTSRLGHFWDPVRVIFWHHPNQNKSPMSMLEAPHCRTGSPQARTNLSPFARCALGLGRHFY